MRICVLYYAGVQKNYFRWLSVGLDGPEVMTDFFTT